MIVSSDATSSKVASEIIHGADFLLDPTRATLQSRHGFHRPYTRGGGYSLASHVDTIRDEIRVDSISKYRVHDSTELNLILHQTVKPERVPVPGGFYERIKTPIAQRFLLLHTPRVAAKRRLPAGAWGWANRKQCRLAKHWEVCGHAPMETGGSFSAEVRRHPAHKDAHSERRSQSTAGSAEPKCSIETAPRPTE